MNIEELKPLEINPFKGRGDNQIKQIANSIESFEKMMSIRKIVIDENNNILGGNKRFFALKWLGYKNIPDDWIDQRTDFTDEEKKEFTVKDNAHWGSEWDFDILTDWEVPLLEWGIEFEDMDDIEDLNLRDNSFNEAADGLSFSITFNFPIDEKEQFDKFKKEELEKAIKDFVYA